MRDYCHWQEKSGMVKYRGLTEGDCSDTFIEVLLQQLAVLNFLRRCVTLVIPRREICTWSVFKARHVEPGNDGIDRFMPGENQVLLFQTSVGSKSKHGLSR